MAKMDTKGPPVSELGMDAGDLVAKPVDELIDESGVPLRLIEALGTISSDEESANNALAISIREQLEHHPHFRGRTCLIQIEAVECTIVLSGRLPTYYLKQLLQEAIRLMPGVVGIDNRVLVMRPD